MQSPPGNGSAAVAGARLCVVSNDQKDREYPIASSRLTIGRGLNNDIVTADPRASRLHAEVRRAEGGKLVLVDPGSTNGTYLNGERVNQAELHDGDLIQIGDFSLLLQFETEGGGRRPGPVTGGTTLMGGALAGGAMAPPATTPDVFDLRGRRGLTVGRDPDNDIILDHPQVSRYHARLAMGPDGSVEVVDLNSTNGTYIDGQQLRGSARVPSGVTLTFGPYRLILQDGQLIKGTEDGTIRIDCLGVTKTVADGKTLLHDLTFSILPREFVCLVGGSGAGKSTLLDAISGVRPATGGEVRYNGSDYYEQLDSYRSAIGYVPQDDIVPAELTVERALYYAAKLRLPDDMAEAEVRARIDEVMDDLGLTERRGVPIKMLSGGQRKRVSIGAELLSKPTLFFLDEPTSGLDPGLEGRMMALLRKLADQGRTIVLITHATQNVDLCDNIAFLAPGGYLAYYGPPKEALNYFRAEKFADIYTQIEREPAKEVWWQRFRGSPQFSAYVGERLAGVNGHGAHPNGMHAAAAARAQSRPPAAKRVSSLRQFGILSRRYLETIVRDRRNVLTLLAQAPLITAMILAVFHSRIFDTRPVIEGGAGSNVDARQLTFLLAMVAVWFGTSNAAREIVKEAAMYARERRINLKLGAYVASKFVVLTGLSLVQNLILLVPFLVTLGAAALLKLPLLYLALIGGSLAGIGMGLVISSQAANPDRASSLVPIILIPQIIFSGIFVNLRENRVLELISHFMATKWTWRALGATTNIDDVPAKALTLTGIPPALAPQVGVTTGTIYPDATGQNLFYVQDIPPDFDQRPVAYLLILSLFIIASVVAVALFQRRKDIVR